MFKRLSESLGRAAASLHADEGLRRGRLLLSWLTAVGPGLARQVAPAEIRGDTLELVCSGPLWAQEVLLRQKDILARLNPLLEGAPLRRLRCRPGRFHPVEPSPTPPREEPYPWESVTLDAGALERIEKAVAEVQEPTLAERLRRLLVQLERRRQVAFAQGAIACGACGTPTRRSPCRTCRREARARRRHRIEQRLAREPWLTGPDLAAEFPDLHPAEFLTIRTSLRSRLEQDIWAMIRALPAGSSLPDGLRARMIELVMLSTGLPAHRLDARHVRHALCPTLARAYLDDHACGPWDGKPAARRPKTRTSPAARDYQARKPSPSAESSPSSGSRGSHLNRRWPEGAPG